jgi:tripartite-type tricarboxylate transporter receptor subunit TctC
MHFSKITNRKPLFEAAFKAVSIPKWVMTVAAGIAFSAASACALAQAYPAKPIRVVVSYAGGAEAVGRFISQKMSEALGQPVVQDPQVGANGSVGALAAARAAPDGYTLLSSTGATLLIRKFLVKDPPYDVFRDFTPIGQIFDAVATIVGRPDMPPTFQQVIELAKKNPGKISYGSSGIGSAYHLSGELIRLSTGADMLHVPYKAGGQNLVDLISGRVDLVFSVYASTQPFVASGKLRNLALITDERFGPIKSVPALRELIPGYESPPFWGALFGPAQLPQAIVTRVQAELAKAVRVPDVHDRMEAAGLMPIGGTAEELAAMLKRNAVSLEKITKAAGIVPE